MAITTGCDLPDDLLPQAQVEPEGLEFSVALREQVPIHITSVQILHFIHQDISYRLQLGVDLKPSLVIAL